MDFLFATMGGSVLSSSMSGCSGGVVDGGLNNALLATGNPSCGGGMVNGCGGGVVDGGAQTMSLATGNPSCGGGVVNGCGGGVVDGGVQTTSLGAGPEVYNNMSASHNCVGGSETSCIPKNPPVGDPSKTGMSYTLPAPAHWYANGSDISLQPSQALALTVAGAEVPKGTSVSTATPGHFVLASHALTLAAVQGVIKGDFSKFKEDAVKNAEAMTPVGGFVVRQITA